MSRLFLPPVNRAMVSLDRSFFQKTIPITAAHVFDTRNIKRVQGECKEDLLTELPTMKSVVSDEDAEGRKRMLVKLKPSIRCDDLSTASEKTREFVHSQILELVPYNLHVKYENWSYREIAEAILPEDLTDSYPHTFTVAGCVAHLNLANKYLPYKHLLAAIILDKAPNVTTVVNKVQDVGSWSNFRTFPMELLAGAPSTEVVVHRSGCVFHFDFAKVYWNTRLEDEHRRLIDLFKPGEAVADVMAGVGPFAVPAAKKKVIVWANDLNPAAYESLKENVWRNKVQQILRPFNQDARDFIRDSIRAIYKISRSSSPLKNTITCPVRQYAPGIVRKLQKLGKPDEEIYLTPETIRVPPTFSHFIMNLPTAATSYLDAFIGAYNGLEHVFFNGDGSMRRELPLIHCYAFHKSANAKVAGLGICAEISKGLGYEIEVEDLKHLENVRMVAPFKSYWRASFRLPIEVAFAELPPPRKPDEVEAKKDNWWQWSMDD